MFSFLSRMRLPGYASTNEDETSLPLPATTKHLEKLGHKKGESVSSLGTLKDGKPSQLNTLAISAPIPRSSPSSITGFDNDNLVAAHGSTHNGSSSASVSTGSAVTAYQYPASFSSLHQQQQQSYTFAQQSHRLYQQPTYSQSQTFSGRGAGPPNVAWVSPQEIGVALGGDEDQEDELDMADLSPEEQDRMARYAHSQFPAVIRLDSMNYSYPHENQPMGRHYAADQMGRSASAPPSETYAQKRSAQFEQEPYFATYGPESDSPVSPSSPIQGRFNLRLNLNTNAEFVQGVQSLRLVDRIAAATNDVFAGAYDYPRAKQLSPIAEVDYVSPDSLKKTKSLPFMNNSSDVSATPYSRQNTNNTTNTNNPSPGGSVSQGSEVTRPSPVYSSPFISRPLNRTVSQTSSRTTTSSSVVPKNAAPKSTEPAPSLPPLDLRPPFPGPHPPHTGSGPPLRPPKPSRQYQQGTIGGLSTIVGSEEGGSYPEDSKHTSDDVGSLHADSFVTASSEERRGSGTGGATQKSDEKEEDNEGGEEDDAKSTAPHDRPTVSGEFRAERMSVNSERSQVHGLREWWAGDCAQNQEAGMAGYDTGILGLLVGICVPVLVAHRRMAFHAFWRAAATAYVLGVLFQHEVLEGNVRILLWAKKEDEEYGDAGARASRDDTCIISEERKTGTSTCHALGGGKAAERAAKREVKRSETVDEGDLIWLSVYSEANAVSSSARGLVSTGVEKAFKDCDGAQQVVRSFVWGQAF
ncbi:hypothetical protein APHAL10511_007245 [Amanita phalloides]|nr:hypothetical protein APHAL10511_007245 [Amanita phalloides]